MVPWLGTKLGSSSDTYLERATPTKYQYVKCIKMNASQARVFATQSLREQGNLYDVFMVVQNNDMLQSPFACPKQQTTFLPCISSIGSELFRDTNRSRSTSLVAVALGNNCSNFFPPQPSILTHIDGISVEICQVSIWHGRIMSDSKSIQREYFFSSGFLFGCFCSDYFYLLPGKSPFFAPFSI